MSKLSGVEVAQYEVTFHVWASKEALRQALIDKGINIGSWADDIFKKIKLVTEESTVKLAGPSVAEIGFKDGAKCSEIYQKAGDQQLGIVQPQVALEFLLQHGNKLEVGQWFVLAMEPIADSVGDLDVFGVGRDSDGLWLGTDYGYPGYFWPGVSRFLFSVLS